MRAMMLTGIRKLDMREADNPQITRDDEVLIRVGAVGICGSDIHYYTAGRIGEQVVQYPFTIGHEFSGIVEKVGTAVTRVKPGDMIAIDPAVACGECGECRRDRRHTCLNLRFLGCPGQISGCMSDYIVMPEENCFPVRGMTPEEAAFVEPLSIGYYAVELLANPNPQRIAILGMGPIGFSVLLSARADGIGSVTVTDKLHYRLALALKMGADQAFTAELLQAPNQFDAVFECCGEQAALDQAIDLLKPGGQLLIVGIPEGERVSFEAHKMRRKEIALQNVRRQNHGMEPAIRLIEQGSVDVRPLISHHFMPQESGSAFDLVAGYQDQVMKAMVRFD